FAAGVVGTAAYFLGAGENPAQLTAFRMSAIVAEVILGFLTFTGSLMAAGKLQEVEWIPQRPVTYPGQNVVNVGVLVIAVALGVLVAVHPTAAWSGQVFSAIVGLAVLFGVLLIIPIGGADMPTVISILNSYAGLSAVAMGFVLNNKLLVTAGALDGSSGLILSIIMCRAMNRSFTNVLFGAFGTVQQAKALGEQKAWKEETVEGADQLLEQARLVVVIPGYGMAVAQAQHKVRELYDQLIKRGVTVKFAIHPVAGRMPGHMNVLLAEANIPYTALVEMEEINPDMPQCDVALVTGANDVVNPAARYAKGRPIYGMPIIDADKANTVLAQIGGRCNACDVPRRARGDHRVLHVYPQRRGPRRGAAARRRARPGLDGRARSHCRRQSAGGIVGGVRSDTQGGNVHARGRRRARSHGIPPGRAVHGQYAQHRHRGHRPGRSGRAR